MNMNREILRIALPNIVSNITVPLMGIVSTAIAGHWGADSAATIGALAIGGSIFNFIYWNCSCARTGTVRPPAADRTAATLPSPPSAIVTLRQSQPGKAARALSQSIAPISAEESVP